jgi:host factor-I protein
MAMQKAMVKKPKSVKAAKGVERAKPAQHRFLTELIGERRSVAIFLVNGLKLEGKIASFDDYAILLEGEMSDHVYKHAISTIQPLAGAPSKVEAGAKKGALRVMTEAGAGAGAKPRAPRQPTIVVRPKRRVIKTPGDES